VRLNESGTENLDYGSSNRNNRHNVGFSHTDAHREVAKMRETAKARILFDSFIEQNEIYAGQISSSLGHFRKDLMIPILVMVKELEKKADE